MYNDLFGRPKFFFCGNLGGGEGSQGFEVSKFLG
jgi:hypothetical protein